MKRAIRNRVLTKSDDSNGEFSALQDVTINKKNLDT